MFVQLLESNKLTGNDIQFIASIALDRLGCYELSKRMSTVLSSDDDENTVEDKNRLKVALNNAADVSIKAAVSFLYTEKLFVEFEGKYRRTFTLKSFKELCPDIQLGALLAAVYDIVNFSTKDQLFELYCYTQDAKEAFRWHVKKNKNGYNTATDAKISKVFDMYVDFVRKYCSSRYNTETRSPLAFMKHIFNEFFDKENYDGVNEVNDIINSKSLDENIGSGEGSFSILDTMQSKEDSLNSINFPDVVTKIQKASFSFFQNTNNSSTVLVNWDVAWFDILSCYRNMIFQKEFETSGLANLKVADGHFKICSVKDFGFDKENSTLTNKYNARKKVCETLLNRVFNNGVSTNKMFSLYQEIARESIIVTKEHNGKDGVALYKAGDIVANIKKKNCDLFKEQLEGVFALQELVKFLNSSSNTSKYGLFNFPVEIFRNQNLAKRFLSLSSYLEEKDDVLRLIKVAKEDEERNHQKLNGIRHNDVIIDYIKEDNAQYDKKYNSILKTPLESGKSLLKKDLSPKNRLYDSACELKQFLFDKQLEYDCSNLDEVYKLNGDNAKAYAVKTFIEKMVFLYQSFRKKEDGFMQQYTKIVDFAISIKNVCHFFNIPFINKNNKLCIEKNVEEFVFTEEVMAFYKALGDKYSDTPRFNLGQDYLIGLFKYAVTESILLLFEDEDERCSEETFADFMFVCLYVKEVNKEVVGLLLKIINDLRESNSEFVSDNNLFLYYAFLRESFKILDFKTEIQIDPLNKDLKAFIKDEAICQRISVFTPNNNPEEFSEYISRSQARVTKGINRYLGKCIREYLFLSDLKSRIYKTFGYNKTSVAEGPEVYELLEEANYEIHMNSELYPVIDNSLEVKFEFDENDFVLAGGGLYKFRPLNSDKIYYVHKKGYKVFVDTMRKVYSIEALNYNDRLINEV